MLVTSLVVEPPRIAIRVGTKLGCVSSSFFRARRLRKTFAAVIGNRMSLKISDCTTLLSYANCKRSQKGYPLIGTSSVRQSPENAVTFLPLLEFYDFFELADSQEELTSTRASRRRSATVEQPTTSSGEMCASFVVSAKTISPMRAVESQFSSSSSSSSPRRVPGCSPRISSISKRNSLRVIVLRSSSMRLSPVGRLDVIVQIHYSLVRGRRIRAARIGTKL